MLVSRPVVRAAGFAAGLLLAALPAAVGHGYTIEPPARNARGEARNGYCPHCGNGHGICGDGGQWPSDSNYVQDDAGPVRTYTAGQVVEFKVKITAHHKGHFELAVCDQHLGPSTANPQACLNRFRCSRLCRRCRPPPLSGHAAMHIFAFLSAGGFFRDNACSIA